MGHLHAHHHGKYHHGHAREGMCPECGEGRHFYTNEEKITWLEDYIKQLEKELEGAKERLSELKSA